MRRWYGWVVLLLVGCQGTPPEAQTPPQSAPVNVEVAQAERGSLRQPLELVGRTQATQPVSIRSRSEGQLLALTVAVGDPVVAGQVLGRLDDTLLRQALVAAEADLAVAQAEVSRVQALLTSAISQVATAQGERDQAQRDLERLEALFAEGAISRQQLEQAQTRLQAAQGSLVAAEAQVQTQRLLETAALSRVQAQQALVNQARERLDLTILRSPISGIVLSRASDVGNVLQNNQEILQVGQLDPLTVRLEVSETAWSQLQPGRPVQVNLETGTFTGQIARISPAADPVSRLFPVEITLPNPQNQLGVGQLARITLPSNDPPQVIIPQTAIRDPQRPHVFVLEADTVRVRPVALGESRDGRQAILEGLEAGETVVIRSSRPLQDGQTVQVPRRS
ncbi:MAG: efflux RND transporter periplasmic adaptor subunit [Thermostichales cyanobacterium BF4_bins_65]